MRNPGLRRLSMKRRAQVSLPAHTIPNLFYLQKKTLSSIIAQKRRGKPGFFPAFAAAEAAGKKILDSIA